ncbi:KilA-N domain-containing protein [Vibrio fluvialis]|nr:KilA-N domain-containing protein [Vibrio fluvialis]
MLNKSNATGFHKTVHLESQSRKQMSNNERSLKEDITMNEVMTLGNIRIRRDSLGRYSLDDIITVAIEAGRLDETYNIETFLNDNSTSELLYALETSEEFDFLPCETKAGRNGGTFVVKELVYHFAMWINPDLYLKVIRSFHELKQQNKALFDHAIEAVLDDTDLIEDQLVEQAVKILSKRIAEERQSKA